LTEENLIDKYIDWASRSCDAPAIYHRLTSYFVASSLLGRYAVVVTSYAPEGIKPNVWALIIGPSRIVRKTTALRLGKGIIEEVDEDLLLPSSFSPEALYETFSKMEKEDCGVWIKDEIGGFFKMLRKRYMAGAREILSSVYSGYGEVRRLRNLEFRIPSNIYVTCLATMPTPPSYYLSDEDFTSGFINRFLIAYALRRDKRLPILHRDPELEGMRTEIVERYKELTETYASLAPIVVSFAKPVVDRLEEYDRQVEQEVMKIAMESRLSLWEPYVSESPNYLMKLAVLRRLARGNIEGIAVVTEEDYADARNDLELFLKSAREVVTEVEVAARPREVVTEERRLAKVYNLISMAGSSGIKYSQLLDKTQWLKRDLIQVLETLMEQDKIVAVRAPSSYRGGRRPIVFYAKENYVLSGSLTRGEKRLTTAMLKALLGVSD